MDRVRAASGRQKPTVPTTRLMRTYCMIVAFYPTQLGPRSTSGFCPVSTDCLPLSHSTSSHSSFLVLSGAEMSQCGMPSASVVEALDVLEDRSSGALAVRP